MRFLCTFATFPHRSVFVQPSVLLLLLYIWTRPTKLTMNFLSAQQHHCRSPAKPPFPPNCPSCTVASSSFDPFALLSLSLPPEFLFPISPRRTLVSVTFYTVPIPSCPFRYKCSGKNLSIIPRPSVRPCKDFAAMPDDPSAALHTKRRYLEAKVTAGSDGSGGGDDGRYIDDTHTHTVRTSCNRLWSRRGRTHERSTAAAAASSVPQSIGR